MKVVILAGGKGTRLWPLMPKQFIHFKGEASLLQKTVRRFQDHYSLLIVTYRDYVPLVEEQVPGVEILIEEEQNNTLHAISYAMNHVKEETLLITPADHFIEEEDILLSKLKIADELTKEGKIVSFGVVPTSPETGYGYIQKHPTRLIEKPDLKTAEQFLESGNYLWNTGIYAFTAETFYREMMLHCALDPLPKISIDYALMEKTQNLVVIPLELTWSDLGSWRTLCEFYGR